MLATSLTECFNTTFWNYVYAYVRYIKAKPQWYHEEPQTVPDVSTFDTNAGLNYGLNTDNTAPGDVWPH